LLLRLFYGKAVGLKCGNDLNIKQYSMRHLITACIAVLSILCGYAQPSALSLFMTEEPLEVILTTDLRGLIKNKFTEAEQPAILGIIRSAGDTTTYDVDVRCRGNIRKETCYFPSIRVKFPKKDFSYHKLKWVNICDNEDDEEYLFKEYIAYKLFNIVTDKSFEVCLVHLHYHDSSNRQKPFTSYGFVIQNADELATEFGGRVHEPTILKESILNPEQLAIFAFFQYMIGNTDWEFGNRHNVEVFTHPETNSVMPVAYDFDYSGFVNQSYAVPHESMPIQHVTVRHNKSVCMDEELCEKTRQLFLEKKEEILSYCMEFELMKPKSRTRAVEYLEEFFKIIEDPTDTYRVFVKNCRPIR
jgi:hypothetical protein